MLVCVDNNDLRNVQSEANSVEFRVCSLRTLLISTLATISIFDDESKCGLKLPRALHIYHIITIQRSNYSKQQHLVHINLNCEHHQLTTHAYFCLQVFWRRISFSRELYIFRDKYYLSFNLL